MFGHWNIALFTVCIWEELACLWAGLCMVTLSIEWRLNYYKHADMIFYGPRNIGFKTKGLHSCALEPRLLVLMNRALNAHALVQTPKAKIGTWTFSARMFSTNVHSSNAQLYNNVQQIGCFVCISTITK